MLNFLHLSQLPLLCPIKIAYNNVLVFTMFSYIEFLSVAPWKVLEEKSFAGESSL